MAFWACYDNLSDRIKAVANKNFALIKFDPNHPSVRLKRVGRYWSARIGLDFRAVAIPVDDGLLWFWVGTHADSDKLISN